MLVRRLTALVFVALLPSVASAQDEAWIDELSQLSPSPAAAILLTPVVGPVTKPATLSTPLVTARPMLASRSSGNRARHFTILKASARSGTESVRCRGGARSGNPDQDITVYADVYLEGVRIDGSQSSGYNPSVSVLATFPSADYDRAVTCELNAGGAWAGGSITIPPLEYPYAVVHSDTQNQWNSGLTRWERHFWLQTYHANGSTWTRGGNVYESFNVTSNPCNVSLAQGVGVVNVTGQYADSFFADLDAPQCVVEADQTHYLSTASLVPDLPGKLALGHFGHLEAIGGLMNARKTLIVLAIVSGGSLAGGLGNAQMRAPTTPQNSILDVSVAQLAAEVAMRGMSAGFITTLPPSLNEQFAINQANRGLSGTNPLFKTWARDIGSIERVRELLPQGKAGLLTAYVSAHSNAGLTSLEDSVGSVPVIADLSAGVCQAGLRRPLRSPVEGQSIHRVISRIAHEVANVPLPGGFAGSCIGVGQDVASPLHIAAGQTFQAALNETVSAFGSSVWVAVQGPSGQCSLGLIQKAAQGDGVCLLGMADNIASSR